MKPFKGTITGASKFIANPRGAYKPEVYGKNLGYCVKGFVSDHPQFRGIFERAGFRTSLVVKYDEATGNLETLNSRYKIEGSLDGPPEYKFPMEIDYANV